MSENCFAGAGEEESQGDGEGGGQDEEVLLPGSEEKYYAGKGALAKVFSIERADITYECGYGSNHYTYY